ncbi:hypothetical protein CH333_04580 [candidate division WOR-3 bacterium JGI_Cruoil_03_44_89]|uniref:PDZ domain-containing protein n=1 Tax=candidate division WOR-3 bacterium JGI_Cruoil_03_44_89 TaxID=1973748 RepID=A0A235BUK9_UNCW3|nr:MAG: hypothetical protein CH333_04580 [candidate division WOR-3 bacterium JGI_Cruoil_03_44_89]
MKCLLVFILLSLSHGEQEYSIGMIHPRWSPDGEKIAFSLHGDIWLVPKEGGRATRVTIHQADDIKPVFSPDGKHIAFASNRNGNYDIWFIPTHGGKPTQITFHSSDDIPTDWSPDGNKILFHSFRGDKWPDLWLIPTSGGTPERLTYDWGYTGRFSPDGKGIVYIRGGILSYGMVRIYRKGYRGSANSNVYIISSTGVNLKRLTKFECNDWEPVWSKDGKAIFFASEGDGNYNIWRTDTLGNVTQVTFHGDARNPDISPQGLLVYEHNFEIWTCPDTGGTTQKVDIIAQGDIRASPFKERILTSDAHTPGWSPDGKKIAFSLQGDIWVMSSSGGKADIITSGPDYDQWPRFSPDGEKIAFHSDRSGNNDIWIVPISGGEAVQVTKHPLEDIHPNWSPDGSHLVFCSDRSGNRDIWSIPASGGKAEQITKDTAADNYPDFSPDGKLIAFDSDRGGDSQIWVIPADHGSPRQVNRSRIRLIKNISPTWSPNGKLIAYQSGRDIYVVPLEGGYGKKLVESGAAPQWSPDGERILFEHLFPSEIRTSPAPKDLGELEGSTIEFIAEVKFEGKPQDIFDEAWDQINTSFYDTLFHGVDWANMREKYSPLAQEAETREELYRVVYKMLGELNTSHTGLEPPEREQDRTGYLGLEFSKDFVVNNVIRGGPADSAGIKVGDRVFAIEGVELKPAVNIFRLLENKANKHLELLIGDKRGKRKTQVKAIDREEYLYKVYENWARENEKLVDAKGEGKLCYVHLRKMYDEYFSRFLKTISKYKDTREGLIIDIRYNPGGNTTFMLLNILSFRPYLKVTYGRGRRQKIMPSPRWAKPVVVIINEMTGSAAEEFAQGIKELKLGKLIGVPTIGRVIGRWDASLADGTLFRVPAKGSYTLEGKDLENLGVEPDIYVLETPEDRAKGKDPQLEKAIEVLLEEIEKK